MLDESACERPNGGKTAVPKLLRSIMEHNPNVFISPSKPKVIGMFVSTLISDFMCVLFDSYSFGLFWLLVVYLIVLGGVVERLLVWWKRL